MSNLHFDELDEKTIKLMHDAGITPVKHAYSFNAAINRLVAVVRADEREACAVACESLALSDDYYCQFYVEAIRSRGEK
jgi:hypothetical protein